MSLSSTNNRDDYTGNGSTANYAYTFRVYAKTDINVYVVTTATGVETTLTVDVDYRVNNIGATVGTIDLLDASQDWMDGSSFLDTGYTLAIVRDLPFTQPTEIRNQGTFYPEIHEDAIDRVAMLCQQLNEINNRSLIFSEAVDIGSFDTTIPAGLGVVAGAGKLLVVNATGTGFDVGPTAGNIAAAEANAIAAAASQVAAAASEAAAAISETNADTAAASGYGQGVMYKVADYQVISPTDSGQTIVVDASGGAVKVSLSLISLLSVTAPFTITVKRDATDTSSNAITIETYLGGLFDEINENGTTTYLLGSGQQSVTLMGDTDLASDQWETIAGSNVAETKGDILTASSTAQEVLAVGNDNEVLQADSSASTGLSYGPSIEKYYNRSHILDLTAVAAPSALSWQEMAANTSGTVIGIAPSSTVGAMRSVDRGLTWTVQTIGSKSWVDLIYSASASLWVGLAHSSTSGVETTNGAGTWTARTITSKIWAALCDTGSLIVAVNSTGSGGDGAMYSTDGITWTDSTACQDETWRDCATNGTIVVASGQGGEISTTTDGDTWTARTSNASSDLRVIEYGNGIFMACSSTEIITSTDGITWTALSANSYPSPLVDKLMYCDGVWVCTNASGCHTSINDGVDWEFTTFDMTGSVETMAYSAKDKRVYFSASSGTNRALYSRSFGGQS